MATSVARKWGMMPICVSVDDLVQEMLLAVHTQLPNHDPKLKDIKSYIVWHACIAARKHLHMCTAHQGRDEKMVLLEDTQRPVQEDVHVMRQRCATLPIGIRQHNIINSLSRTGSLHNTAAALLADPLTSEMFSTTNLDRAKHSVYRTAVKLAQRAQSVA